MFQPSIKDFKAARVAIEDLSRKDSIKAEKFSFGGEYLIGENLPVFHVWTQIAGLLSGEESTRFKESAASRDDFVDELFLGMEELTLDPGKGKRLAEFSSQRRRN